MPDTIQPIRGSAGGEKGKRRMRRAPMARILILSLALGTLIPFPPLAFLTWQGYRDDLRRVEESIGADNRQIAHLAATHLEGVLRDTWSESRVYAGRGGRAGPLPSAPAAVRWELVGAGGEVIASQVADSRVGRKADYAAELDPTVPALEPRVSAVGRWIDGAAPTCLQIVRVGDRPEWLVAVLNPVELHREMTAASSQELDRHVYVVDRAGQLIFYSNLDLSSEGRDLRPNPPVKMHIDGRQGPIRFESVVSGKERIGYVRRIDPLGFGVVVSADIGSRVVDVRERYVLLLWAILFAVASLAGIFWWTSHRLARPLMLITDALREVDSTRFGPLLVPASARQVREYDNLVRAFDGLSERHRQTERELVQAEKAAVVGQLASGIAHETGTPLNVIKGNAQYLLRKLDEDSPARRELNLIIQHAERITSMIRRVLEFSRPTEPRRVPIALGDVVENCLEMTTTLGVGVEVRTDLDPDTPLVLGDSRLLEHVILNLLVNAYQAMPDGGQLTITVGLSTPEPTQRDGAWVCCRFADTGCGIPAEDLEKVFQPFYSTKPQGKGTGLGLAIAERIVTQHDGRILVASQEGRGTMFALQLRPVPDTA